MRLSINIARLATFAIAAIATTACGGDEVTYTPKPAPTAQVSLASVPSIPQKPIKQGEAYTVWGASYHLRSRVHKQSIDGKDISLVGYITKTNLESAPKCAVHETGKEDPDDCKPPVPTFWIGDTKDASEKDSIKVMGWASNFAQLYDAIKEYKKRARSRSKDEPEPFMDGFWGVAIPDPLPVKGAKVTVKGNYSMTFTKATAGAEVDPIMGVMTYAEMKYEEKPEELATLPGMR